MILTVDIGNSNIKVGAWDGDKLEFVARLQTSLRSTQDEYAIALTSLLQLHRCNENQFDGAIISSVVPPLSATFRGAIEQILHTKRVFLIGPGIKTGLNIRIDNPGVLGADIVCAAVAALAKYPTPCVVVGLGTATTLTALGKNGDLLGVILYPGIGISLDALSQRTAQLPHISLDEPAVLIGKNSVDSMRSGIVLGTAGMLDGLLDRLREELGESMTVVALGGYISYICKHCRTSIIENDELVMEGLRLIYYKNLK
jgi:pantothenate kinase, type III